MKTVVIIQARVGSTRLPGKVLLDVCGAPLLARVIRRAGRAQTADEVIVATSTLSRDDAVADLAKSEGVRVFRGSESDVLSRYAEAAKMAGADIVVRITADCPLVDPSIIDRTVRSLRLSNYDFASVSAEGFDPETQSVRRTFPRGLDVEVCWADVLYRCERLFDSPRAREHVFTGVYEERPELFLIRYIRDSTDHGTLNWSVDTQHDLDYIRVIYDDRADYRELLARYAP